MHVVQTVRLPENICKQNFIHPHPVVGYADGGSSIADPCSYNHTTREQAFLQAMLHSVLHQGLENERGDEKGGIALYLILHCNLVPKACLLNRHVGVDVLKLRFQGDEILGKLQAASVIVAEIQQQLFSFLLVLTDQ
ncbi:hypothetical protein SDC9_124174 [bioreactor metagenome]|uniref:Uncharacterized protein n=1 Tax=bioreactor metagenome TaxID=1076179 RepID=A0A645CJQ5_9ZZZZ